MEDLPAFATARLRSPRSWRLPRPRLTPLARREARQGYLFIAPWIVGFLAFTAIPMIATLIFTFFNLTLSQEQPLHFVGLDNYARLLGDARAGSALGNTVKFAAVWLPVSTILPFALALGLNSRYLLGAATM